MSAINPKNIQGDIYPGIPKKAQTFFFFEIVKAPLFRSRLVKLVPHIATSASVSAGRVQINEHREHCGGLFAGAFLNIAFSSRGLKKCGVNDNIQDTDFTNGQFVDAKNFGDNVNDWEPEFKGPTVDCVLFAAGDSIVTIDVLLAQAKSILDDSITEVIVLSGHVRPGAEEDHEHFGFLDGISQPSIQGLDKTDPSGQGFVDQGVVFLGRTGDPNKSTRPSWALDGSILAFRYLQQLVPEFHAGVALVAPQIQAPPSANAIGLTGARLVGRWASGAPIQLTPLQDNSTLATANKFFFDDKSQKICPFAAHIRKMNPRGDTIVTPPAIAVHRILRHGIQYGPEVTAAEALAKKTIRNRGLLFVSYQSVLANGFAFLQKVWANPKGFPPGKPQQPGIDPIIGVDTQDPNTPTRVMSGLALNDPTKNFNFANWIRTRGGEYFFSPSIKTLETVIGKPGDL